MYIVQSHVHICLWPEFMYMTCLVPTFHVYLFMLMTLMLHVYDLPCSDRPRLTCSAPTVHLQLLIPIISIRYFIWSVLTVNIQEHLFIPPFVTSYIYGLTNLYPHIFVCPCSMWFHLELMYMCNHCGDYLCYPSRRLFVMLISLTLSLSGSSFYTLIVPVEYSYPIEFYHGFGKFKLTRIVWLV